MINHLLNAWSCMYKQLTKVKTFGDKVTTSTICCHYYLSVYRSPFTIHRLLLPVHCAPFTVHCSLFTVWLFGLFTVCCVVLSVVICYIVVVCCFVFELLCFFCSLLGNLLMIRQHSCRSCFPILLTCIYLSFQS